MFHRIKERFYSRTSDNALPSQSFYKTLDKAALEKMISILLTDYDTEGDNVLSEESILKLKDLVEIYRKKISLPSSDHTLIDTAKYFLAQALITLEGRASPLSLAVPMENFINGVTIMPDAEVFSWQGFLDQAWNEISHDLGIVSLEI